MTLEELKQRILDTGYLPEWLKDSVDLMGSSVPPVVLPATIPPQPETKKWCPMARVNLTQTPGTNDSFNRMIRTTNGVVEIATVGAFCIGDACQMWSGSDCGLKNINADILSYMDRKIEEQTASLQAHMSMLKAESDESQAQSAQQHQDVMGVLSASNDTVTG